MRVSERSPARPVTYPETDLQQVVDQVGDRWGQLDAARILLTGATGFVGGWMLDSLAQARRTRALGTQVVLVARDRARLVARRPWVADAAWVEIIESDVREARVEGRLTHVIHCASAASAAENRDDPARVGDLIVRGTTRVMEIARAAGASRVLHLSSGAVHRTSSAVPSLEQGTAARGAAVPAADLFAHAKRLAEAIALRDGSEAATAAVAARCFALVGPGLPLDGSFAVGNFIRDLLAGGPIGIAGDGRAIRSYLYAADLAAWCWVLLLDAPGGSAWDVGGTEEVSMCELADRIAAHRPGVRVEVRGAVGHGAPDRYVPDVRPAAKALGLAPRIGLDEALHRMIAWHTA